jgi:hypothetical protein
MLRMGHLFMVFGATPICRGLWYGAPCFWPPHGKFIIQGMDCSFTDDRR